MVESPHSPKMPSGQLWRRLALAIPVSLLLHLLLAVLMRPRYQQVSDFAVDLDVMVANPGPPAKAVPIEPVPEPAPELPPKKPEKKKPKSQQQVATKIDEKPTAEPVERDGGTVGTDGGVGDKEGGICMPNLFAYSEPNPSWILWLSMASFRNTVYEDDLARFLRAYKFSRRIISDTRLESTAVEGLLVSTDDVFDWQSYRVVVSYDSGEEKLRSALDKRREETPALRWLQTTQGWEGTIPGSFRYHLVSSGRVLAVTHAPEVPADADGGTGEKAALGPGAFPGWPSQVECISARQQALKKVAKEEAGKETRQLIKAAREFLVPDAEGHWPVMLLATQDPRTVGIGLHRKELGFRLATVRIYFTDPIRIEGQALLSAEKEQIELYAKALHQTAAATNSDPFMALAGLSHIFNNLVLVPKEDRIEFTLTLSENRTRAALIFLQLQGAALERRLER